MNDGLVEARTVDQQQSVICCGSAERTKRLARRGDALLGESENSQLPTVPVVVSWRAEPRVPAAGKMIVIQEATPTSLLYRIE